MQRLLVAVIALALLSGCAAQRVLEITSEPPGATVLLDGEPIGTTPLEHPFEHYGVRRITLYKVGYQTNSEPLEVSPPWFSRFPLDLVTEILLPFGWSDRHIYRRRLVEGEDLEDTHTLRDIIARANRLRVAGPNGPRDLPPRLPANSGQRPPVNKP